MDFTTAIRTCFSKYVDFSGRARRSEYWYFALFNLLASFVALILDNLLGTDYDTGSSGLIGTVLSLALFLPSLAVGVRRLHDTGRSGWWLLLWFVVIIGWIVLIVWLVKDGDNGENKHGADPKGGSGALPTEPPTGTPYYGQ